MHFLGWVQRDSDEMLPFKAFDVETANADREFETTPERTRSVIDTICCLD